MANKIPSSPTLDRRRLLTSALLGTGMVALSAETGAALAEPPRSIGPMTAQAEEGPYYLPLNLTRADITEGLSGIPVDIRFTVVDETGLPYTGALIDIWHCDAQGVYSGFEQPAGQVVTDMKGRTFLRGVQPVNADGARCFIASIRAGIMVEPPTSISRCGMATAPTSPRSFSYPIRSASSCTVR